MKLQSLTSAGDAVITNIAAGTPPTAKTTPDRHLYSPGSVRLADTWRWDGPTTNSWVVIGSRLYQTFYGNDEQTGEPFLHLNPVGGGWDKFTLFASSQWGNARTAHYGLRSDGVLFRWTKWSSPHQYAGFASVKTMTVISETKTYDTFLATTHGGALYTIHIPVDLRQAPIVKKVRTSTWQGFETLVAEKCGTQSTLLTAIDKDTGSAYLYAVSHANGASTVIQGLGKVPGTYKDPVISRWAEDPAPPMNGE